jgi:hypothetical protein
MLADSIPAAHSALTEMSAHPVSKSSFKYRLSDPTPIQKRPHICNGRGTMPPKPVTQMSVMGQKLP